MLDIEEDVCQGGIGYVRRFMQRFAYHQGVDFFYMCDDSIIYFKTGILDKDNHIRRNDRGLIEMEPVSFARVVKEMWKSPSRPKVFIRLVSMQYLL